MKLIYTSFFIFIILSCSTNITVKNKIEVLKKENKELSLYAKTVTMDYLSDLSNDSLYRLIMQKCDSIDYPFNFLKQDIQAEFDFFSVPYFTISRINLADNNYLLLKDSTFIRVFLINNKLPFSEIDLNYDSLQNVYYLNNIQSVSKDLWQHYKSKIDKGYLVFKCNLKIDEGNSIGTAFLPYIFYINNENEIVAHNWLKGYEISMEEVIKKIP